MRNAAYLSEASGIIEKMVQLTLPGADKKELTDK